MSALPARFRQAAWLGLMLLFVTTFTGCISEAQDGDKTIYTNAWWAAPLVMLLSVVAGLAGFALLETATGLAIPLMLSCPIGLLVGLSLGTDRCEVGPAGFQGRMNFGSSAFQADFDDIASIEMVTTHSRYSSFVEVVYHTRDGKRHEFSLGDAMAQTAGKRILSCARHRGIAASDNR